MGDTTGGMARVRNLNVQTGSLSVNEQCDHRCENLTAMQADYSPAFWPQSDKITAVHNTVMDVGDKSALVSRLGANSVLLC